MSPSYVLLMYVTCSTINEGCADSVTTPKILLNPGYINEVTPVFVRCESSNHNAHKCQFYKDRGSNPIHTTQNATCQIKVTWNKFISWKKTEVELSCAILGGDGKTVLSKMSNMERLKVNDPIGITKIHVENTGVDFWTLRCVATAGELCNFYLNNIQVLIKETPFQRGVCVERVSTEVLWKERMMSSGDVSFSCEVKLKVRDEGSGSSSWAVKRSEPYNFTEKASLILSTRGGSDDLAQGFGPQFPLFSGLITTSLFCCILLIGSVVCCYRHREGANSSLSFPDISLTLVLSSGRSDPSVIVTHRRIATTLPHTKTK
ncbi:uncharacterized protein LOC134038732 isoform X2 [Osmerus eperlanus]|uniref:uncharacterized protein LOC134038732 isoform X2 n=1 Tax=Osmerus eperlanus TaxID=29151 RepID=UPI002E158CB9